MSNSLDPRDCSLPGSSVHGIFQARILEWVAIFFSRIVLAFKSMIYLELFLYVQCELGVEVPFFPYGYPVVPAPFIENVPFSIALLWNLC